MGWMEVLALLKRLAPLLSRLAPTLETFLAARTGRADAEAALARISGDMQGHVNANGDALSSLLADQTARMAALSEQVTQLRAAEDLTAARLLGLERSLATLLRSLWWIAALGCLGLVTMVLLLLRRTA